MFAKLPTIKTRAQCERISKSTKSIKLAKFPFFSSLYERSYELCKDKDFRRDWMGLEWVECFHKLCRWHHLLSIFWSIACRAICKLVREIPKSSIFPKYDLFRVYDGCLRFLRHWVRHNFIAEKGITKLIINLQFLLLFLSSCSLYTVDSKKKLCSNKYLRKIHLSDYFQML